MTIKHDPKTGQFLPGNSGRPRGARNRLQHKFVAALAEDFEQHGEAAIRICRMEEPTRYLQIIASIMPKEFIVEAREVERMSDEEIQAALDALNKTINGYAVEIPMPKMIDSHERELATTGSTAGTTR